MATLLQRSIGLGRNILFCGLLADEQLGRWSLTFNFLLLAAPLIVLGLPGSFGRYVEHYRQRNQLRTFLLRTSATTICVTVLAAGLLFAFPHPIARLVYGDPLQAGLVRLVAVALAAVIGFNFLVELFTALRLVRFAALIQLVSSLGFAISGVILLYLTPYREAAIVLGYGFACLIAVATGVLLIARFWSALPQSTFRIHHYSMWSKLLPFAGWIWATNLVCNLFEVADQFMLKHFSGLPTAIADSLIGQYYCSRIMPLLLVSVAGMIASSLLPHLSHDWEAGRRRLVEQRLQLTLKVTLIALTIAGAIVLAVAPLLFNWLLGGRYEAGLAVLPGTLTYCVWYSAVGIAICYLLCAEAAHLSSLSFMAGLGVNVFLNYLLAPRYGLGGVVLATLVANVVAFAGVIWLSARRGMHWDAGVYRAAILPFFLLLGGGWALALLAAVMVAQWRFGLFFDRSENEQLGEFHAALLARLHRTTSPLPPCREASC